MTRTGSRGMLVALSGLPGVGKTAVARRLSGRIGGVHLRIDTIESALVKSGLIAAAGGWGSAPAAGYQVAYLLATDLLLAGHVVIADSVNPLRITRQCWTDVALSANVLAINVEVICSDVELHRGRAEARTPDLEGLTVPTWEQVQAREYESWDSPVLRVNTASGTDEAADEIVAAIRARLARPS